MPAQQSIDVLLRLSPDDLNSTVSAVAIRPSSVAGYSLIDRRVRYTSSDAERSITPTVAQASWNDVVDDLLFSHGLSLLGHAARQERSQAVDVLLRLGADARTAMLPLVNVDALPEFFKDLAADPFVFVAKREDLSASQKRVLLRAIEDTGTSPSMFARKKLEQLGYRAGSRQDSCGQEQESDIPISFIGYRQSVDGEYTLSEFVAHRRIGCTEYAWNMEGSLRIGAAEGETALLTLPTARGRAEEITLAALTRADGTDWIHYVGEVTTRGDGLLVAGGDDVRFAFANSTRPLEEVRDSLELEADSYLAHCQFLTPLRLRERPTSVQCYDWTQVSWDVATKPGLIVVADAPTGRRRIVTTADPQPVVLPPGEYFVSGVSLSDARTEDFEVNYVFPRPRVSLSRRETFAASWPEVPYRMARRISGQAEQFVHLRLEDWANVALTLTELESDVDVVLTAHGSKSLHYMQSTGDSYRAAELSGLLPPGRYLLRLRAIDGSSPYTLELSSVTRAPRPLEFREAENGSGTALFSFHVEASAVVRIAVESDVSELRVALLDRLGEVLTQWSVGSGQVERISYTVDGGTFYISVFPSGDESGSEYTVKVRPLP